MDEIKLKRSEYEALRTWARAATDGEPEAGVCDVVLRDIDKRNSLRRHTVVIAWSPLPETRVDVVLAGARRTLELTRPPTKADIYTALSGEHYHESSVLLTADPNGVVGWYDLEHFPWG